jgi:hypothetical protein
MDSTMEVSERPLYPNSLPVHSGLDVRLVRAEDLLTVLADVFDWSDGHPIRGPHGTIELHALSGSTSPDYKPCDLRTEHGADCVFQVVSRTRSGVRLVCLYGFDPAGLD